MGDGNGVDVSVVPCLDGFNRWNITYDTSYIYRISLLCLHSSEFGKQLGVGSSSNSVSVSSTLSQNQKVTGFQIHYDTSGLHAIRITYVDFLPSSKCHDDVGKPNGECPTNEDWIAILWGFLTIMLPILFIGLIIGYIKRTHKIKKFAELDTILPLK